MSFSLHKLENIGASWKYTPNCIMGTFLFLSTQWFWRVTWLAITNYVLSNRLLVMATPLLVINLPTKVLPSWYFLLGHTILLEHRFHRHVLARMYHENYCVWMQGRVWWSFSSFYFFFFENSFICLYFCNGLFLFFIFRTFLFVLLPAKIAMRDIFLPNIIEDND